jgi:broad specificity phosphatase PhoE
MALKPPGPIPIYFARHGETLFNVERRWQGSRNDSGLTEQGRAHARETGLILRALIGAGAPPRFVSSPMGRARATMEGALEALGLPTDIYTTDERLAEIDLGEWTGILADEVKVKDPARWEARQKDKWNIPCPGGESFSMAAARAESWLLSVTEPTVAISHGVFGRVLRALYLGLPPAQISGMEEPHGSVFRLEGGRITRFDHTPGAAPV